MYRLIRRPAQYILLAIAAACGGASPTATVYETNAPGIQAGYVSAAATRDGLDVGNQTSHPIYLVAAERETTALLDLAMCTGGPSCPALAQGQHRVVPWREVIGYSAAASQFVVYWWRAEADANGTVRATGLQSLIATR
jgi:hypothetical protein